MHIDAAKKYHEYLVRQEKPMSEEQKVLIAKNNRITQRRQRVCMHVNTFNKISILYAYIYIYSYMKGHLLFIRHDAKKLRKGDEINHDQEYTLPFIACVLKILINGYS